MIKSLIKHNGTMDCLKETQNWVKENKGKFEIGEFVFCKKYPENGIGIIEMKTLITLGDNAGFNYRYGVNWLYVANDYNNEEKNLESVERYRSYLEDYHESCKKAISNLTEDLKEI